MDPGIWHRQRLSMEIEVKPVNPKASILRIQQGIRQGAILVALAVLIGAGFNGVRPSGLPWVETWPPSSMTSQGLQGLREIAVEEAWSPHKTGQALFLDARDPVTFQEGHLPGALNIPREEAGSYAEEVRTFVEAGMQVIAYCDGVHCPLSPELAPGATVAWGAHREGFGERVESLAGIRLSCG